MPRSVLQSDYEWELRPDRQSTDTRLSRSSSPEWQNQDPPCGRHLQSDSPYVPSKRPSLPRLLGVDVRHRVHAVRSRADPFIRYRLERLLRFSNAVVDVEIDKTHCKKRPAPEVLAI